MQTRVMKWTVVIIIALIAMVASVAPTQAQAPFTVRLCIEQSDGVFASGTVTFTHNGNVIGGPYNVYCPHTEGYASCYEFGLPQRPNDIEWNIAINWTGACGNPAHDAEQWTGANQPWPATYTITHSPGGWEVSFYPSGGVGGIIELPQIEEPGTAIPAPDSSGHNYGALAGIIAGAIAGVTALISAAWYIRRRRTKAI